MSSLYDVEVDLHRSPYPYRVSNVNAKRAQEVVEGCLIAWNKRFPLGFDNEFVQKLVATGEYYHDEDYEYRISVKRAEPKA